LERIGNLDFELSPADCHVENCPSSDRHARDRTDNAGNLNALVMMTSGEEVVKSDPDGGWQFFMTNHADSRGTNAGDEPADICHAFHFHNVSRLKRRKLGLDVDKGAAGSIL